MSQSNLFLSPDDVRAILEVGDCSRLNDHPLTRSALFQEYVANHPEKSELQPGETLFWLLFDIWRAEMYPADILPELVMAWNRYLLLIVVYFFPLMTGGRPTTPKDLTDASVKLRRRKELILIVANGDTQLANELLEAKYEKFWIRLIASDKELTSSTLSARREAAVQRLTKHLNARLALAAPLPSQSESPSVPEETACEPVPTEPLEPGQTPIPTQPSPATWQEDVYPHPLEWLWRESETESNGLLIIRWLGPSPIDRWLDEPNKSRRLAGELQTIEMMMDSLGPSTSLASIQNWLPTSFPSSPEPVLLAKWEVIRSLIDNLLSTDLDRRALRYAVLLQRADLTQPLEMQIQLRTIWNSHRPTGIESLAEAASNGEHRHFTRAVIRALLARDDHILKLWKLHRRYQPLVFDLLLAMKKNLSWNKEMSEWEVTDSWSSD